MANNLDTIFALATAAGRAGVSIIRVSGPSAFDSGRQLAGSIPISRGVRNILAADGSLLDEALILVFRDGNSFTGEDVVELHLHGSPAIVQAVTLRLSQFSDLRLAEPGEFTRRALENGKLDLAQVEGLADLIDAETEAQRKQAVSVFSGALGQLAEKWRRQLVRAAALIEATIDFVDEDVPVDVMPEVNALLCSVQTDLEVQCAGVAMAERIRDGFEVAIVGAPNVGKSTLLNRLAGRDAAITSEIAGTTRDVIEVRMDIAGLPVTLLDTAGLRATDDVVEGLGVSLAKKRAREADLRIFLLGDKKIQDLLPQADDVVVYGKADKGAHPDYLSISGLTGLGIDALITQIGEVLNMRAATARVAIRQRHRQAMLAAVGHIETAKADILASGPEDLIAEEIRTATRAVDMLVGRVDVEDLLDEIFLSFCIGK